MGWFWDGVQAILSVLNFLGIWQQDKQEMVIAAQKQIIQEGRDDEAKVLSAFADELRDDMGGPEGKG
jgi:hypothetical protein